MRAISIKAKYDSVKSEFVSKLQSGKKYKIRKIHINKLDTSTGQLDKPHNAEISLRIDDLTIMDKITTDLFTTINSLLIDQKINDQSKVNLEVKSINGSPGANDYISLTMILENNG